MAIMRAGCRVRQGRQRRLKRQERTVEIGRHDPTAIRRSAGRGMTPKDSALWCRERLALGLQKLGYEPGECVIERGAAEARLWA
jgi:hypothetical protein